MRAVPLNIIQWFGFSSSFPSCVLKATQKGNKKVSGAKISVESQSWSAFLLELWLWYGTRLYFSLVGLF